MMQQTTFTTQAQPPGEAQELHERADKLIRSIYEKRTPWSARQTAHDTKLKAAYACVKGAHGALWAWQRMLNHLGHNSPFLSIEPVVPHLGPQPGNTFIDALMHLALHHEQWRREPEAHTARHQDCRRLFGALARHLLADYTVPEFLDAAWFEGFSDDGTDHRNWFATIGAGRNIRTAKLPLRLTSMGAHCFLKAPADWSIVSALRWGQVHGFGGDEHLASALAESKMGQILPDEPFWESVIHFFLNHPEPGLAWVNPVVDFIYAHRFGELAPEVARQRTDFSDAPDPMLTMKGRTVSALQKRIEEWHAELAKLSKRPRTSWPSTGMQPLAVVEADRFGTTSAWSVVELTDSRALQIEGSEMRHCVFTYADACHKGTTSIWSLRVKPSTDVRIRRVVTIEVNNTRRAVVQVRGRCNKSMASFHGMGRIVDARRMLRDWAQQNHLGIACSIG